MKSPADLAATLARQWSSSRLRQERLLSHPWPLVLRIGKPGAKLLREQPALLRRHVQDWRQVKAGKVEWQTVAYRDAMGDVQVPQNWLISSADEWIAAADDRTVAREFRVLRDLLHRTDERFHAVLIERKAQVLASEPDEVVRSGEVAMMMEPGLAAGQPLRSVSVAGIDSKFLERNRQLLTALLACRFGDTVNEQGLENFLDAAADGDHWVLLFSLDTSLLPFQQQRVRCTELTQTPVAGSHLLIVENEQCRYRLPMLPGMTAVLGAGLDLQWLSASWISGKHLAYWGDIDTWGLRMLALARAAQPDIEPLLMDQATFDQHHDAAVHEPQPAMLADEARLSDVEWHLFNRLQQMHHNRLEQEFIPVDVVSETIRRWWQRTGGMTDE